MLTIRKKLELVLLDFESFQRSCEVDVIKKM